MGPQEVKGLKHAEKTSRRFMESVDNSFNNSCTFVDFKKITFPRNTPHFDQEGIQPLRPLLEDPYPDSPF